MTIKTSTYQLTDNQLGSNPIQNFLVILVRLLINYYEIINLISTRFQPADAAADCRGGPARPAQPGAAAGAADLSGRNRMRRGVVCPPRLSRENIRVGQQHVRLDPQLDFQAEQSADQPFGQVKVSQSNEA